MPYNQHQLLSSRLSPVRPSKISREELLKRCANTFKRLGYNGTTMDELSAACGLTKASFYHHYPSKEALLRDVLAWTHEGLKQSLFSLAYDESLSPKERLEAMGRKAKKLFLSEDSIGCLMGVVAIDATYTRADLMAPIREFFNDWMHALTKLYEGTHGKAVAQVFAQQLVADYEGAILLARIYNDSRFIDGVTQRASAQLEAFST